MTEESPALLRDEFEAEYRREMDRHCPGVITPEYFARSVVTGDYMFDPVQSAWWGWHRSRAALTIKMPPAPEWPDPADHDDMDIDELEKIEAAVGAARAMRMQCLLAFEGKGVCIE